MYFLIRLTYVRSVAGYPGGVTAIAISSTTGDIVTVCDLGNNTNKSTLQKYKITVRNT